jgi:single-stranded DNA-binding protein
MKGIEAHFTCRLSRGAESRATKAGKPMVLLSTVVSDGDADTWISILAFEGLAEQVAALPKGTEVYARGKLKAALYQPEGGEPRVSLTLMASTVEPLVLERKPRKPRPPAVYGDSQRRPSSYTRPARGGEDFDDRL